MGDALAKGASRHIAFIHGGLKMQDTEEDRWLLLDMARAMGGYGYDEEIHAPRFSAGVHGRDA